MIRKALTKLQFSYLRNCYAFSHLKSAKSNITLR